MANNENNIRLQTKSELEGKNRNNTGGKFATGVADTGGAPWLANISANIQKNLKPS
jgi:hypothetical protein